MLFIRNLLYNILPYLSCKLNFLCVSGYSSIGETICSAMELALPCPLPQILTRFQSWSTLLRQNFSPIYWIDRYHENLSLSFAYRHEQISLFNFPSMDILPPGQFDPIHSLHLPLLSSAICSLKLILSSTQNQIMLFPLPQTITATQKIEQIPIHDGAQRLSLIHISEPTRPY